MFPTHSGMAFGVARRRTVNSITTSVVVPGIPVVTPPVTTPPVITPPVVTPPGSPATIESTQPSTIPEEDIVILREGPQRSVVIVNPRDRDPYRYAIGPYEPVTPRNARRLTVMRAHQINSDESNHTLDSTDNTSPEDGSITPPSSQRRNTYDWRIRRDNRASSLYSRPISTILDGQQQRYNRDSYYTADPELAQHAEIAENFLSMSGPSPSDPRYVPERETWASAVSPAADFVDEDRDDDGYSYLRGSEPAASIKSPSILVDDDTVPPLPWDNIIPSPGLQAQLQRTLSKQTHQTSASSNPQSTLENRWNRRIEANDEPTLLSIERRPKAPLPTSASLTETMERTFHDIKERQEGDPTESELRFTLGHHHATDSPCQAEYLKVAAEINGLRTSQFASPSSPLILLPGLCGYAQDYADFFLRTNVEPHRQDPQTRAEEEAKVTTASYKMVNDWLDDERREIATRQFTPSASVIALQPISRPQTSASHSALASPSRNPFKRAIDTLKKRKTMSDIKDVATAQAKKDEKKGRSIGSFLFGRAAASAAATAAPRTTAAPPPHNPADNDNDDAAALSALAARTAYNPAAPLALFSEAARRLHLTNRATSASVVHTEEGLSGHLTVANWLQAMKYRSGEREKELFSRIVDGGCKWVGVGMNGKGRWCVIVVG